MELSNQQFLLVNVVYVYDMSPLEKISLDKLKEKFQLPEIAYNRDLNIIIFGNAEDKWRVSIESTKMSYIDENRSPFKDRKLENLYELFGLVSFKIKAYGVNLHIQGTVDNPANAAEYIRDMFLSNRQVFEKSFGGEIFGYSTRFFLDKPEHHRDLRFFPVDLRGNSIRIDYHMHRDISIVDSEKLVQETKRSFEYSIVDFSKIIDNLWRKK